MRLLLDTQVALWWLIGAKRLSPAARRRIAASVCTVSVASVWEVAISTGWGNSRFLRRGSAMSWLAPGAAILPIEGEHAIGSAAVAIDHADPFDRLLIATALAEGLQLLTADAALLDAAASNRALPILAV